MASESNHDLPADILEKLQNLELELEEGDITLKGFEKKKASLLASVSPAPNSPQQDEAALLAELGPEPSAADVTDFLDFLPSPTHSPTRNDGAALMEENHKQVQYQQQYQQQQSYQNYPQQQQQQQQPYQPYPPYQTNVYHHQGSPQARPNMVPGPYRPYPQGSSGRPINNNPIYYNNNPNNPSAAGSPVPNNRPYMMGRPQYITPQQQQRPIPPQGGGGGPYGYGNYRPNGSPQYNTARPPQNMYNSPRPMSTSPRPIYRPNPNNPAMYNPRPGYVSRPPPNDPYYNSVNRSLSTNSGINTMANKPRQGYTDRQQHSMSMYSTGSESEWNQ